MNKSDFLDLLNDYLSKYYRVEETQEILRDYEEYFINGKLDHKSEAEIISELGSPKKIVLSLINEEGRNETGRLLQLRNRFYQWYENRFWNNWRKLSEDGETGRKGFLAFLGKIISFSSKILLWFSLHLFVFTCVLLLLAILITLICLTLAGVLVAVFLTPVSILGFQFLAMTKFWIIFPIALAIGLAILMLYLILGLGKLIYRFILEYIHWVKVQMLYKKALHRFADEETVLQHSLLSTMKEEVRK